MSSFSRLTYNSINLDFDRAFNQFMLSNVQNRAVGVTLAGTREQINFYAADRLKIAKRVLSRTFESQLAAFWEYVKSGQTFAFRWDRDLLAYMAFENLLVTNDAVAGTLTRATTGTYVNPSTGLVATAASGAARHPAGKFGRGFLCEKAATNILLRSEEFDNAAWTAASLTIGTNTTDTKDPAGGTAAERAILTAATGTLRQDTSTNIGTNGAAFSVWLKGGSTGATSATLKIIRADTSAVLGSAVVTVNTTWQRFAVRYDSTGNIAANWGVILELAGNTQRFFVFGAQLEVGSEFFETSYIATAGASVTRNADQLVYAAISIFDDEPRTGSISFWFAPEWDIGEFDEKVLLEIQGVINNYFLLVRVTPGHQLQAELLTKTGTAITATGDVSVTLIRNTFAQIVVTWDFDAANGLKLYFNGASLNSQTINTSAPDRIGTNLRIGFSNAAGLEATGVIDDLEIRRDVLTAAEILARYNMAKPLGWRRNYWSSLMIDDDAYAPELLVGGYRWGMELNFVEQK